MSASRRSRVTIVAPRRPGVSSGNDVTAVRWQQHLQQLGHDVLLANWSEEDQVGSDHEDLAAGSDVLVVLHARRCAAAVVASRRQAPDRRVVVALTGTDLYVDLPDDQSARASIDSADRLVVLQDSALGRLRAMDPALADKSHVIYQSVGYPRPPLREPKDRFVVLVLAHMRNVKDPLLAARAARLLGPESRVQVVHAGHAHDDGWRRRALEEQSDNHRYRWLGELNRPEALELLASSTVLACTSKAEGGANVVTEAMALGVPVVGTAVDGTVGLLGEDYPGLVPVGDAAALAEWLTTLETTERPLEDLRERIRARSWICEPHTERSAWAALFETLAEC